MSTLKAGLDVLKKYGLKTFLNQLARKYSKHNFERADEFLNRAQQVLTEKFVGKNEKVSGLVSVIIPCYNHEDFVADALYSIYNQTYEKIEIILIDDFSTDKSAQIVEKLFGMWEDEKRFYNLKFIKNEANKGAHYSINRGLNEGAGEYFAVLNSDDLYDVNRFETLIKLMQVSDAGLSFSKVEEIDENGMIKKKTPFSSLQNNIDNNHMLLGLCGDNLAISSGNLFFKREVMQEIGLFRDFKYIHDWDFLLRGAGVCKVVFSDKTSYYYRMHSTNSYLALNSMTDLCDAEMLEVRSRVFKRVYANKNSNFYDEQDYDKIVDLLYRRMVNNAPE